MKRTPWFSPKVKPVHVGLYERKVKDFGSPWSFWNGEYWGGWGGTPMIAVENKRHKSSRQDWQWRGLATKPKGKK